MKSTHISPFFVAVAAITATAIVPATAVADDDLVQNSPFIPEGWEPPREPEPPRQRPSQPEDQPLDRVEFRGFTTFNGERTFSLHDPDSERSFWLAEGQGEAGFRVVDYKPGEDAVVVEHNGTSRTIQLRESRVQATPEERRSGRPSRPQRGQSSEQVEEDPEERMQNLAEEIRRRREARRQILERSRSESEQSGGQSSQPAVPTP